MTAPIPLLWLCGAPGVGKSTVGFAVFARFARAGVRAAFADADQLGLCYPAPPDDPGNDRVKARNLGAVWAAYRAAGARCLIFSGGVESAATVRSYAAQVPGGPVAVVPLLFHCSTAGSPPWISRGSPDHLAVRDDRNPA